jgi:hypothetical protein
VLPLACWRAGCAQYASKQKKRFLKRNILSNLALAPTNASYTLIEIIFAQRLNDGVQALNDGVQAMCSSGCGARAKLKGVQ